MKAGGEFSSLLVFFSMDTVTGIEEQKRRSGRVNVFLSGSFAFSLERGVVLEHGLSTGQTLTQAQMDELLRADGVEKCLKAALRLLSYRPRSVLEMRERLCRKYARETVDAVLLQLEERNYVDDVAFAQFWRESRESFNPRSRRMLTAELRRKGIRMDVVSDVLEGIDDEESAYNAAKKCRRGTEEDYEKFRNKLAAFLGRRGFDYDVIKATVERLWQERG